MGLFSKKKKDQNSSPEEVKGVAAGESVGDPSEAMAEAAPVPKRPKKKNERMSSVLRESVVEAVLDDVFQNEIFVMDTPKGKTGVCMLLAVDDIGGLSRKDNKDEAKGSIIEGMNSGMIKNMITPALMEDEKVVIIPDAPTLLAMDEFSILTSAPYEVVYVYKDGGIELTGVKTTHKQATDVMNGLYTLSEFVSGGSLSFTEEVTEEFIPEAEEEIPDLPDDLPPEDEDNEVDDMPEYIDSSREEERDLDDAPVFDDDTENVSEDDGSRFVAFDEETSEASDDDAGYAASSIPFEAEDEDNGDDVEEDAEEEVEDEPATEEEVIQTVRRTFYSDDLDLEISTEAYDQQFMQHNQYMPLEEMGDGSWLGNYYDQMVKRANHEMERQHRQNLLRLRERYLAIMTQRCEAIQREYDFDNTASAFGRTKAELDAWRVKTIDDIKPAVAKERERLEISFREKVEAAGEEAAARAKAEYRERHGRQHDDEMYRVEASLRDNIEHHYQMSMTELRRTRREKAHQQLDWSVSGALDVISAEYEKLLKGEQDLYDRKQRELIDFVEANKQDEIARIKVLADDLARSNKIETLTAEYKEQTAAMKAAFDAQITALNAEKERIMAEASKERAKQSEDHAVAIEAEKQAEAILQQRIDDLMAEYRRLEEETEKKYQIRMDELRSQRDMSNERCEQIERSHKRSNLIGSFCVIAIAIAMVAIGFIIGFFVNNTMDKVVLTGNGLTKEQMPVVETVDMDSVYQDAFDSLGIRS